MKSSWVFTIIGVVATTLAGAPASADFISTASAGTDFGDEYSYLFQIFETADPDVFEAHLTNTSIVDGDPPLIDLLAFNVLDGLEGGVSIDFNGADWAEDPPPPGEFDFILEASSPGARLAPGDTLVFTISFAEGTAPGLAAFLLSNIADGGGIGGGSEEGQVAVSFQQLGGGGQDSDLLTSSWDPDVQETPEPGTLLLIGAGLLGIVSRLRRETNG